MSKTIVLGDTAVGTISPKKRILNYDLIKKFKIDLLSDKHWINLSENNSFFASCIDGRPIIDEDLCQFSPNSAGGVLSALVAKLLVSSDKELKEINKSSKALEELIINLKHDGVNIGGHGDDHSTCGCGANAKLKRIIEFIANNIESILDLMDKFGLSYEKSDADFIQKRARNLINKNEFFDEPSSLDEIIQKNSSKGFYHVLSGNHNEVLICLNTKPHKTINKKSLREEYGDAIQVFSVDAWALHSTASRLTDDVNLQKLLILAMTIYNFATAYVLCSPDMEVILS